MLPTQVPPTRGRSRRTLITLVATTALVTIVLALCLAHTAWAAGTSTTGNSGTSAFANGGQDIGNALEAWGRALLFAVAALMGLGALVKRSVGEGVTILIIVLILGAFLFDQSDTEALIRNLWSTIGG